MIVKTLFIVTIVGCALIEASEDSKCQTTLLRPSGNYQFSCLRLTSLYTHMEKGPINTTEISVANSKISTIPRYSFVKFGTTLEILELRNCGIEVIENEGLGSLVRLQKLVLAGNNLREVDAKWFKDTPYLRELDVSFNQIKTIYSDVYQRIPYLTVFYLDYNQLETIDYSMFPLLGYLKRVKLGHNPWDWRYRAGMTWQLNSQMVNYNDDWEEWGWMSSVIGECQGHEKASELNDTTLDCVIGKLLRMNIGNERNFEGRCINEATALVQCTPGQSIRETLEGLQPILKNIDAAGAKFHANF